MSTGAESANGVSRDTFALLFTKIFLIGPRYELLMIAARCFDHPRFTQMALLITTSDILRVIADWGLDVWATRIYALGGGGSQDLFRQTRNFKIVTGGIASALLCLIMPHFMDALSPREIFFLSLTAWSGLILGHYLSFLQASGWLSLVTSQIMVIATISGTALATVTLLPELRPQYLGPVTLIGAECCAIWVAHRAFRTGTAKNLDNITKTRNATLKTTLRASSHTASANLVSALYSRVDQYVTGSILTATLAAQYQLALKLSDPLLYLYAALSSTLHARIAPMLFRNEQAKAIHLLAKLKARIFYVALASGGIGIVAIRNFFPALSGTAELQLFTLITVCTLLRGLNMCNTAVIQASGDYRFIARVSWLNAATSLIGLAILGRAYGGLGVAGSIAICESINFFVQYLKVRNVTHASQHNST